MRRRSSPTSANVAVIGAGPAGLGVARVLRDLGVPGVRILERDRVGASFLRWPLGMRFVSPCFPEDAPGRADRNAISYDSSPARALKRQHPTGRGYAAYLQRASEAFGLRVETGVEVMGLLPRGEGIDLVTNRGTIRARFVIWAAGQFQYPELASGGRAVTVVSREAPWADGARAGADLALAPRTRRRLNAARKCLSIDLVGEADVVGLERTSDGVRVLAADGRSWTSLVAPVLATGFVGSTRLIANWLDWSEAGRPVLTEQDELTRLPGLFLVGPEVQHHQQLFCLIYKFRQRFAVVGRAIAGRLGVATEVLEVYRAHGMYLDDLGGRDAAEGFL